MATFTQDQLDKLNEAISQGALIVQYADKRVEYRSLNEMMAIRRTMMQDLGLLTNTNGGRLFAKFNKGLD